MQKTILIIDDESAIRRLSQRLLQRKGYLTLEAENGTRGLQQLEQNQDVIDAVLLDLHLPDGSGKEWAVHIRNLCPEIPIIYFTGSNPDLSADRDDLNRHFLKKPFTPDSIVEIVGLAVGGSATPSSSA